MTDTHNLIHHGGTIVASGALPFFCSLRSFAGVQRRMEMRRVARKKPKEAPIRKRNRHSNEPNEPAGLILSRVPSDIRSLATIARPFAREKDYIYSSLLIIQHSVTILLKSFIRNFRKYKFQYYFVLLLFIIEKSNLYF